MISDKDMRATRRLEYVPRWNVMPTLRRQSVAEHSYFTTVNCIWLLDHHVLGDDCVFRAEVLEYSILHDKDEAKTGDTPSPNKPFEPPKKTNQVKVIVKCADLLEALQFVHAEVLMGNTMGMRTNRDWMAARLHEVWDVFEWDQRRPNKPITSDLIRQFELFVFDHQHPHPVLE